MDERVQQKDLNLPAAARGLAPCEDKLIRDVLGAPQIRTAGYYMGPAAGDGHAVFPPPSDRLWFVECYGRKFAVMARTSDDALADFRSAETGSRRVAFAQGGAAFIVGSPDTAYYTPYMGISRESK